MIYISNIFKVSLFLLVFMGGIMVGQTAESKQIENGMRVLEYSASEYYSLAVDKELVDVREGKLIIYFDSLESGVLNLIICNCGESKFQEVSIQNLELDGQETKSYANLDGIGPGEVKICPIDYEMSGDDSYMDNNLPNHIKGWLYVRGSQDYYNKKIDFYVKGE